MQEAVHNSCRQPLSYIKIIFYTLPYTGIHSVVTSNQLLSTGTFVKSNPSSFLPANIPSRNHFPVFFFQLFDFIRQLLFANISGAILQSLLHGCTKSLSWRTLPFLPAVL